MSREGEAGAEDDRVPAGGWRVCVRRILFGRGRLLGAGWGPDSPGRSEWGVARNGFVRGMGLIYLVAILSWWVQLEGLVGPRGILPADQFLSQVEAGSENRWEALWRVPTWCWIDGSGVLLPWLCGAGAVFAVAVVCGLLPGPLLLLLWSIYLSLATTGGVFMNFQWDALLLEAGLLAALLAPWSLRLRRADLEVSRWALFLCHWLLFRLMFFSGFVKLASGDPTWRDGTALQVHYETQPLPHAIAWFVHQLPDWAHWFSVKTMFGIELALPFLIFLGRIPRLLACLGFTGLNLLIIATGNYTYFNYLTLVLCVLLVDDSLWPRRWREVRPETDTADMRAVAPVMVPGRRRAGGAIRLVCGALVFFVSLTVVFNQVFRGKRSPPEFMRVPAEMAAPFRSVNGYGLFARMTQTRPEIIVEGSRDGVEWTAYEFRWKPGELARRPRLIAPHQPRLDWQMWFAALRGGHDPRRGGWFTLFMVRLLESSEPVLGLMGENPFPEGGPRFVRARLYRYEFTDMAARRETGHWWEREYLGEYCPEISLR